MSNKYFLIKVDIGAKQKYIFSTNVLKEVIGASEIIRFITEELGRQVLKHMNSLDIEDKDFTSKIFDGDKGNVLIEAGGNSIYIFEKIEHAKIFNNIFSKFVMQHFDGLELIIVIQEFCMKNNIKDALDQIENKLTKKKGQRKNLFKRISYGLTRICSRTKKPGGYKCYDNEKISYISKESHDKLKIYDNMFYKSTSKSNEITYHLNYRGYEQVYTVDKSEYLKEVKGFAYTTELDKLAGSDEKKSYIGITCIDGNGMGEKINRFYKNFKFHKDKTMEENNLDWLKQYRNLTEKIKLEYKNAYTQMIDTLIERYDNYKNKIFDNASEKLIPVRPIILAGDDITFISNGKIAIEATKLFTENITNRKIDFGGVDSNLTVSSGIAIVRKKYPFSRAVKLAGELEKSSKKKLKEIKDKNKEMDASFIDWYVDRGNILQGLTEIRSKEKINLTARPYMILPEDIDEKLRKIENIDLDKFKEIFQYKFYHFYKVLNIVKKLNKNSNLRGLYRNMNISETDANLFSIKYLIKKDFNSNDLKEEYINKVIYDVIDVLDLYENVSQKHKEGDEINE